LPLPANPFSTIQFYLVAARGALHIGLEPAAKAIQVKDVPAFQSLGLFDLLQAYNAGVVHPCQLIFFSIDIWETLELGYQLPRLNEELDRLPQTHKSVNDLRQQIDRELLSR
jgi:hypothetical protein